MKKALVLGASGFLGGHMERRLKEEGYRVVSVARQHPRWRSVADEFNILDLTNTPDFHHHFFRHEFDEVYQFAAEGGGLGYIGDPANDARILTESFRINLHTLQAIVRTGNVGRLFFASSQCVYPRVEPVDPFQSERIAPPTFEFREQDARFDGNFAFAKEKLYAEELYLAYARARALDVRIGRLGNCYGPFATWTEPRAKAVMAICRKVAEAPYAGVVKLWGDGTQRRSFTYVADAIEGIRRLMQSDYGLPLNIASSESVTIAELFETVCTAAGKVMAWEPDPAMPVGVAARSSDNTLCRQVLGWEPSTPLSEGIKPTYKWVAEQVGLTAARAKM